MVIFDEEMVTEVSYIAQNVCQNGCLVFFQHLSGGFPEEMTRAYALEFIGSLDFMH